MADSGSILVTGASRPTGGGRANCNRPGWWTAWRLDIDIDVAAGGFRGVQMTPHNSEASVIFGKGIISGRPGSAYSLVLAVKDIDAARDDFIARGVDVTETFHYAGGPFNESVENPRVGGHASRR